MHTTNTSISTEIKAIASSQKPKRRRFSTADKLRIVRETDACLAGGIGAFLRREGIYSSQLQTWRKQRDAGELDPSTARKHAQSKNKATTLARRVNELECENRMLRRKLVRVEQISEIQKQFAGLMGIELVSPETNESVL